MKFRTGITVITEKLFTHWSYDLCDLKQKIKSEFLNKFKYNVENEIKDEIKFNVENEIKDEIKLTATEIIGQEEEIFEIIPKKRRRNICCIK
jgi:hypothetical protein